MSVTIQVPSFLITDFILEGISSPENELEYLYKTDWIDEGKWQYQYYYFKYKNVYAATSQARSGSYYSDLYYDKDHFKKEFVECSVVDETEVAYEKLTLEEYRKLLDQIQNYKDILYNIRVDTSLNRMRDNY